MASASSATSAPPIRAPRRGASRRSRASSGCAPAHRRRRGRRPLGRARRARCSRELPRRRPASDFVERERLPGREADRRRAARRRGDRRHRPRRRSVARGRPGDGALRLGARRLGPRSAGATMAGPPARMRRAGHRRLLRRPRLQGRAGPRARGLPDRRDRRRRPLHRSPRPPAPAGCVDAHTVKEQLLYEVHDPAAYLTPDVVADITRGRGAASSAATACALHRRARPSAHRRRSRSTSASRAAGSARRRSPTPGRAPKRARGSRRRSCASASAARSTSRFDLIGVPSVFGDDAGRCSPTRPPGDCARRAPARRGRARRARARRAPARGGHGALHLRPGRRRRRAHRLRPRLSTVSCLVPRERGAGALRDPGREPMARVRRSTALAHGRTGDKGNRSNISVIAYRPGASGRCSSSRSPKRGSPTRFAHRRPTAVKRYLLPKLHGDELRARRRARRRRQRLAQPRHPRQGARRSCCSTIDDRGAGGRSRRRTRTMEETE